MNRKTTRKITVGNVPMGGDAPVVIQSMTNTDTRDVESTLNQIRTLYNAGCEIIRCAVPDMAAAEAIKEILTDKNIKRNFEQKSIEGSKIFNSEQVMRKIYDVIDNL